MPEENFFTKWDKVIRKGKEGLGMKTEKEIQETFSCERCKTIFWLNRETWKSICKQNLSVFCPKCKFKIYTNKKGRVLDD